MSLLQKCIGLDPDFRKPLDVGLIWEGNYWDDQDVHDCCDVDWDTCEILVKKIATAFSDLTASVGNPRHEKIVVLVPRIMQLPLIILAAYRAGLVSILLDPLTTTSEMIESVIESEEPKLFVTVDSFWQAQKLIEVKKNVENLRGMEDVQLLVIRHVAPNDGVPPPKKDIAARRPYYGTSLDLRNGKDLDWSVVMSEIDAKSCKPEFIWKDSDVTMKLFEKEILVSVSKCRLVDELEASKTRLESLFGEDVSVENIMVIDSPHNLKTTVNLLTPWYMGKTLTLFEGRLDYPDSSRLAQIIIKHSVHSLISVYPVKVPNPEYLEYFSEFRKVLKCSSSDVENNLFTVL